ncbi:TRAP transporter large permease subunit, partial [Pseudomonas aeruginosa]|uniref:TRAP transporter large permease subunit n=1 Tax=Pseudomonas aeruginosa TaxID=287 RepID=UPI002443DE0E
MFLLELNIELQNPRKIKKPKQIILIQDTNIFPLAVETGKLPIMLKFINSNAMLFSHVLTTKQKTQSNASWVTELRHSPLMFMHVVNIVLLIAGN